jgi:glycosyltransferase involved in cell wall biosynthesis
MKVSVVIPVLNERASLPATIAALRVCRGIAEIIVADGGSTDGTVQWLQAQPDIVLVRSIRGKGPQINVGAAAAFDVAPASDISQAAATETPIETATEPAAPETSTETSTGTSTEISTKEFPATGTAAEEPFAVGSAAAESPGTATAEAAAIKTNANAAFATRDAATEDAATKTISAPGPPDIALLFLHADCLISQPAIDALHAALADPQLAGGAFYIRFAEAKPPSLRIVAWGINLRARLRGSATGDQGIFVRKSVFESIGGAPEWPLFEDVELVRRIRRAGRFTVLHTPVTVSGRRYIEHGVLRTALLIYFLRFAYWLGVPPRRLKNWFKDARGKPKAAV